MHEEQQPRETIFTKPGYSLTSLGSLFLGIVIVWCLNGMIFPPFLAALGLDGTLGTMLFSFLNSLVLMVVVPALYLQRRNISPRAFSGFKAKITPGHVVLCVCTALGVWLVLPALQYLWYMLLELLHMPAATTSVSVEGGVGGWIFGILLMAVSPAICEEFLFRGVLLRAAEGVYGPGRALALSTVLFALMHTSIVSLPTTLLTGVVMGYVMLTTRSVVSTMIMHFVHNAVVLTVGMLNTLSVGVGQTLQALPPGAMLTSVLFAVVGVAILVICLRLLNSRGDLPQTNSVYDYTIPLNVKHDLLPFLLAAVVLLSRVAAYFLANGVLK